MNQFISPIPGQFSFSGRELSTQLLEHIDNGKSGYWQHTFDRLADRQPAFAWNVGIANGQILYSGSRTWSTAMSIRIMERYIAQTHGAAVKLQLDLLKLQAQEKSLTPTQFLLEIEQSQIISVSQIEAALRTKILNDLDIYLLMGSGSATFIATDVDNQVPIKGFKPIELFDESKRRHAQWVELRKKVPSMQLYPILDRSAMATASLSDSQRQRIEKLVQSDKTLNSIAEKMSKDSLEVAQMFAKLVNMGLVTFKPNKKHIVTTVMVIDDSPVLLSQFQHWVSALGYVVTTCQDAKNALDMIKKVKPSIIFIDINMPEISGFELVKSIRQQPDCKAISLAILTGEQKLSNKWRAQWSGCEFLEKPLTSEGISDFQVQLEELIPRLLNPAVSTIST
jgi:CheY-like chemotaxis protein